MADAISAAPDTYTVLEENDRVRILMYDGGVGPASPMHSHPDLVAITITDSHVRFTAEDGESMDLNLPAGAAMFDSAKSHSTEVLSGHSKVILVELK